MNNIDTTRLYIRYYDNLKWIIDFRSNMYYNLYFDMIETKFAQNTITKHEKTYFL